MEKTNMGLKEVVDCPCGCGRSGTPRKKKWRDGKHHTRNCDKTKCPYCRGSSEAKTSAKRERGMSKELGARRVSGSGRGHGADMVIEGQLYIETTKNIHVISTMRNAWLGAMGERVDDRARYHSIDGTPWCVGAGDLVLVPFKSLVIVATSDFCNLTTYQMQPTKPSAVKTIETIARWYSNKAVTTKLANLKIRCKHAQLPGALMLEWESGSRGNYYGQLAVFEVDAWKEFLEYNPHQGWDGKW